MRILLMGTGKTGTTALAYGIKEKLPNYQLIFEPTSLTNLMYEENMIVKSVKIGSWKKEVSNFDKFDKKILIVRHPYDKIISHLLYIPYNGRGFSDDHNSEKYINFLKEKTKNPDSLNTLALVELFNQITKADILKNVINEYKAIENLSAEKNYDFYLLKYEDFVDRNLKNLENYLGIEFGQKIEVGHQHNRVTRTKGHDDWYNWFTQEDIEKFGQIFSNFNEKFNYQQNIPLNFEKNILPENSYLYTINVINEYRKLYSLPKYEEDKLNIKEEGIWIDQAIEGLRRNKLGQAEKAITQAIEINPNLAATYLVQGKLFYRQKKSRKALKALSKCLELDNSLKPALQLRKKIKKELVAQTNKEKH